VTGPLVVGVDAGGTTTRCVIATVDGAIIARGRAGGANQRSSAGSPAEALAAALRAACTDAVTLPDGMLTGVDPSAVAYGVVGAAGAGGAGQAAAQRAAETAWREVGLAGRVVTATDLEVAFAAGSPSRDGLLLLAGTGAAAASFHDGALRHRCDGYGWLLGDEGGAVWLGREALLAVLAALDGRGTPTSLTATVTGVLLDGSPPEDPDAHAQALIGAAYAGPPAALGRLAPLVSTAALAGDELAGRLVSTAAKRLLSSLTAVANRAAAAGRHHSQAEEAGSPILTNPVVLAGSVLLSPGPVADLVRAGVREHFGVEPRDARDGAAGAAALAIAALTGHAVSAEVHARLTGAGQTSITT
jgi:glucosamine kinase